MLTTEALVSEIKEDDKKEPAVCRAAAWAGCTQESTPRKWSKGEPRGSPFFVSLNLSRA
jgi:hypothetical protein